MSESKLGESEEIPHAVWSGEFFLFGVPVKCHTLSDGQRIIEPESVSALFAAAEHSTEGEDHRDEIARFSDWQHGKSR